jgi:hypothetical protein
MSGERSIHFVLALVIGTALAAAPARADINIIQTSGSTDPTTLGFTNDVGGSPAPGSAGIGSWNISGAWCCDYALYSLNGAQASELSAAATWTFTATFANLSNDTSPAFSGSYADVIVNSVRFDLGLHSDGSGDQILSLNTFTGTPAYTITGLGNNPATLSFIYNNTTQTGDAFVNGAEVISGFAGRPEGLGDGGVFFGGENGEFSNVDLQTGSVLPGSPTPEPTYFGLLAVGLGGILFVARRRRRGGKISGNA